MQKNKNQIYEEIKDIKTKKEFLTEINKIKKDFDDLLDEDTAALLLLDELGRNKQNICKISELKPDTECTVYGQITNIDSLKKFSRKNGSTGKVINLELKDETGTCKLVLWDKDVELVTKKKIQIGTKIKVINGYTKNGFNKTEINVGRWSLIEIEPQQHILNNDEKLENNLILEGKLIEIEPTKAFFKNNGNFGFITKIKVQTKQEIKEIIVWDEKVKEIQKIKKGQHVKINNISIKENNGKKEFHLNSNSFILKF